MDKRFGIERQRGSWLRCFLSAAVAVLLLLLLSAPAGARHRQLEEDGAIRITHVAGRVANHQGAPVDNVEVTLEADGQVAYRTRTDVSGSFAFERLRGHYWLRVARGKDAPAARELEVTDEIVTALERKRLYILLGPGACQDDCSQVFTSQRDFEKAIKRVARGK